MFMHIKRCAFVLLATTVFFFWGDSIAKTYFLLSFAGVATIHEYTIEPTVLGSNSFEMQILSSDQKLITSYFSSTFIGTLQFPVMLYISPKHEILHSSAISLMPMSGINVSNFVSRTGEEYLLSLIHPVIRLECYINFFRSVFGVDGDKGSTTQSMASNTVFELGQRDTRRDFTLESTTDLRYLEVTMGC